MIASIAVISYLLVSFIDSSLELLVVEELLLVLLGFALSSDFLFLLESSDFFVVIWLVSILGFELSYD
ncbi:hypothetical protein P7H30_04700 [Streptococcus parauberis]|uniref:hypothetical protein n=1 Tax=Streptococcus parauberis TaxID=1348 RepID=UPI0028920619|nr:hypothetical protein [Streptococcus parauberis]MDT2749043.1 hypothetical protein [Streptococcus parauberis]